MGMYPAHLEDEIWERLLDREMKTYTIGTELERKVGDVVRWIDAVLAREDVRAPVVLWSGGKDSMVMLDIIRHRMELRLPVVLFREPWWPEKYAFHDRITSAWNLEVYSPPPIGSFAYEADDHVVLMARYQMRGDDMMDVPKDVIEMPQETGLAKWMKEGPKTPEQKLTEKDFNEVIETAFQESNPIKIPKTGRYYCGQTILTRPRGTMEWPWDTAFIGHKDSDTDPVLGAIPLHSDFIERPEGTSLAYPLRKWTDADVWAYIEAMNVPMDIARYDVANRTNWEHKRYNADWIQACTRCLTTSASASCHCPKWNRSILGVRERVAWVDSLKRDNFQTPDQDQTDAIRTQEHRQTK